MDNSTYEKSSKWIKETLARHEIVLSNIKDDAARHAGLIEHLEGDIKELRKDLRKISFADPADGELMPFNPRKDKRLAPWVWIVLSIISSLTAIATAMLAK